MSEIEVNETEIENENGEMTIVCKKVEFKRSFPTTLTGLVELIGEEGVAHYCTCGIRLSWRNLIYGESNKKDKDGNALPSPTPEALQATAASWNPSEAWRPERKGSGKVKKDSKQALLEEMEAALGPDATPDEQRAWLISKFNLL